MSNLEADGLQKQDKDKQKNQNKNKHKKKNTRDSLIFAGHARPFMTTLTLLNMSNEELRQFWSQKSSNLILARCT